jgi:alkanesulfonate monooxygenase
MQHAAPRFGIWALVHGSRGAFHDPEEPFDASWPRNRALVLEAEALGYATTLIAQHTANPYNPAFDQLEAWTAAAALAEATTRIELIAAIKPLLYHPVVLAKMAMGIEQISQGRFAINLVNAWNGAELENAGLPFPEHDARYDYGAEWLAVVERLFTGETLTHHGQHFQVRDYRLRPPSAWRARPRIYLGGESAPARALAARSADTWFMNAQPLEQVQALIRDLRPRPRGTLAPLDFGLSAFVVARPSEAEAIAAHDRLLALAAQDRAMRAGPAGRVDRAVVMRRTVAGSVGTNGGSAAGLVGSYAQVAERIRRFHAAGIGTFLLQFQPFEAEMRRFAAEVMPRVTTG